MNPALRTLIIDEKKRRDIVIGKGGRTIACLIV